jgi:predicted DsbA family dithiol-disulfide isomerase
VGAVHVQYFTDPACPWSWATEPAVRRLQVEFGDQVSITYVMGGLAREFREPLRTMRHVLDADHVHWLYDTTNRAELRAGARRAGADGRALGYCLRDVYVRSWVV